MNNIKKITLTIYLMFVLNFVGTSNLSEMQKLSKSIDYQKGNLIENYQPINKNLVADCTVKIVADGVELEITFHDISRFRCVLIKVGKWFQDTF